MKIFLKKKISDRIAKGHQWVFQSEVGEYEGNYTVGDQVSIHTHNGVFIGKGLLSHKQNSIIARIYIKQHDAAINESFWKDTIHKAIAWRKVLAGEHLFFRWINGDIDGLSGLVVDQMDQNIIISPLTAAVELRIDIITKILAESFPQKNIIVDKSHHIRKYDGLPLSPLTEFFHFSYQELGINLDIQNPSNYSTDRILIKKMIRLICKGKSVWDIFSGNGGLGCNAIGAGAREVLFVENHPSFLLSLTHTIINNGLGNKAKVVTDNAFKFLKDKHHPSPDIIIIDAPNFAIPSGADMMKPYIDLMRLAIGRLVINGGMLIFIFNNSNISFYEAEQAFQTITQEYRIPFNLLQTVVTPPDYGINILYPHTNYLKGFLLQIASS